MPPWSSKAAPKTTTYVPGTIDPTFAAVFAASPWNVTARAPEYDHRTTNVEGMKKREIRNGRHNRRFELEVSPTGRVHIEELSRSVLQ